MGYAISFFFTYIFLLSVLYFLPLSCIDVGMGCDFFKGSWIYDDTYPLYNVSMCSFVDKQFDCVGNGRQDRLYLKYRWKPADCELPKFIGQDFLSKFRGKKLMFVGDSLSLNQWQSLACMIHAAVPQSNFTLNRIENLSTFHLPDYNISLMLSRNAFLVDLVIEKKRRILKLDSIQNGNSWKGVDMLIFNTWHWWLHKGSQKPWDYIQQGDGKLYKDMDRLTAFGEGLKTWSKWVDSNINSSQTKVFFQGISPTHYSGSEWNAPNGTCKGESQPINASEYPVGMLPPVVVVKGVLSNMSTAVELLDVTRLSQLRKDGHPSVYGAGGQKGNDCSHWCLAGVPDTWNQLLYGILLTTEKSKI